MEIDPSTRESCRFSVRRMTMRTLLMAFLGLILVPFSSAQVPHELAAALQEVVDHHEVTQPSIGLSVAVTLPGGRVWAGTAGWSNPDSGWVMLPEHRLPFASITKTLTATSIMLLVEEGVIDLEDSIGDWLPPFTYVNSRVTVRQLLGHTSGIYNFVNFPNIWEIVTADLDRHWEPEEVLTTFMAPPVFFAGSGSGYSNTNYILLGLILEEASGSLASDFIRDRLLDPHDLDEIWLSSHEEVTEPRATTWYNNGFGRWVDYTEFNPRPAINTVRWTSGSLYGTATDIARWARALYGGSVLTPQGLDEMLTFQAINGTNAIYTGYGLGVQQFQSAGYELWGHSGWVRGATSNMVYSPALDVSIAVVDNDTRTNHTTLVQDLLEVLGGATLTAVDHLPERVHPTLPYPNPVASGQPLTIEASGPAQLVDLLGRRVGGSSGSTTISTSGLAPGIYLLRVEDASHLVVVK